MGGGVCGAIFVAAGAERLQNACDYLAPINTGEAVVTQGFNLPAKYIIHAAGPVYHDGNQGEEALLRQRPKNTAKEYRAEEVLFVITTDGMENSSREFTYDKIKAMIERQKENYGWEFIFHNDSEGINDLH